MPLAALLKAAYASNRVFVLTVSCSIKAFFSFAVLVSYRACRHAAAFAISLNALEMALVSEVLTFIALPMDADACTSAAFCVPLSGSVAM